MKIQFCSGEHRFEGWFNTDLEFEGNEKVDITQPLPFADESADYVFCSHGVEHVTAPQAFRFFQECFRILKRGGVMRICVPSISRVATHLDQAYINFTVHRGYSDGDKRQSISHLITHHGHLACWGKEELKTAIWCAGFDSITSEQLNKSKYSKLRNLDKHGEVIGEHNNFIESIVVEAVK
jgi:predicted SAM-dependent methyltransferase